MYKIYTNQPIIATDEGFSTIELVHANRKAGILPKASLMYGYSAPDFGIIVPSSAYVSDPMYIYLVSTEGTQVSLHNISKI